MRRGRMVGARRMRRRGGFVSRGRLLCSLGGRFGGGLVVIRIVATGVPTGVTVGEVPLRGEFSDAEVTREEEEQVFGQVDLADLGAAGAVVDAAGHSALAFVRNIYLFATAGTGLGHIHCNEPVRVLVVLASAGVWTRVRGVPGGAAGEGGPLREVGVNLGLCEALGKSSMGAAAVASESKCARGGGEGNNDRGEHW